MAERIRMMRSSHKIIFGIFLSFGLAGFIEGAFPQTQGASFIIHSLFIAMMLFAWCGVHADENGIMPPNGAKLLCGLIGLIGVPFYLFRAFGFKKGGYKFLLCVAAALVIFGFYEASLFVGHKYF